MALSRTVYYGTNYLRFYLGAMSISFQKLIGSLSESMSLILSYIVHNELTMIGTEQILIDAFKTHMDIIENKKSLIKNDQNDSIEQLLQVVTFMLENIFEQQFFSTEIIMLYFSKHIDIIVSNKLKFGHLIDNKKLESKERIEEEENEIKEEEEDDRKLKGDQDQSDDTNKDCTEEQYDEESFSKENYIVATYAEDEKNPEIDTKYYLPPTETQNIIISSKNCDETSNKEEPEDLISCMFCESEMDSKAIEIHDKNKHMKGNNFFCPDCEEKSEIKKEIVVHYASEHKYLPNFKCNLCDEIFFDSNILRGHIKTSHDMTVKSKCPFCQKHMKRGFRNHLEKDHNTTKLKCNICGRLQQSTDNLNSHIKVIHPVGGIQKQKCNVCGKLIQSKSMDKHLEIHESSEASHTCKICSKIFQRAILLQNHLRRHLKRPKYKCKQCDYSSKESFNLKVHINAVHLELRKFPCKLCDKVFKSSTVLKKHVECHEGVRNHFCKHCGKSFRTSNHRNFHESIHEKKYYARCDPCDKNFVQKYNFTLHQRKYHSSQ